MEIGLIWSSLISIHQSFWAWLVYRQLNSPSLIFPTSLQFIQKHWDFFSCDVLLNLSFVSFAPLSNLVTVLFYSLCREFGGIWNDFSFSQLIVLICSWLNQSELDNENICFICCQVLAPYTSLFKVHLSTQPKSVST